MKITKIEKGLFYCSECIESGTYLIELEDNKICICPHHLHTLFVEIEPIVKELFPYLP